MEALQRNIADAAVFADDLPFDPSELRVGQSLRLSSANRTPSDDVDGSVEVDSSGTRTLTESDAPVVVGVDQAFLDERAVSAIVAIQDGAVIERVHAVTPLEIPYIPGLLAFREGNPILAALAELSVDPDLAVFDGSGRIHFRQAGIATHIGVMLDLPSIGVAKRLLCGKSAESVDDRPEGWSTPVESDANVEAPDGTVIGHAYQSRQWGRSQSINPLYISPGHRVSAATTVELVDSLCAGYKLPEPTRLADHVADDVKMQYE